MKRYAHRTDDNQVAIVEALRGAGYTVLDLSAVGGGCPDLLVAGIDRETGQPAMWLLEIKTRKGVLNLMQMGFIMEWRAPVTIVRTIDEALRAVGAI